MEKSGSLNIYRNAFMDVEELNRFFEFNLNSLSQLLFTINAQSFGVVNTAPNLTANNSFRLSSGSVPGTIRLLETSYGVDSAGKLIFQEPFDNFPIQDENGDAIEDQWAWVRVEHEEIKHEDGVVSIDENGNLLGINSEFRKVLRGQGSGLSTFIQLYIQNDDGSISVSPTNSQLYGVTDVIDDTSAVLNGDFTAEANLRYVVFGTFALGERTSAISAGGIYNYNGAKVTFWPEVLNEFPPLNNIVEGTQFFVARVRYNTATNIVEVQDRRSFTAVNPTDGVTNTFNNYYQLNFGDIIVNNKANIDATNIPAEFADEWRTAIGVTSTADLNTALSNKANIGGNNITNPETWRTALDVPANASIAALARKDATGLDSGNVQAWKTALEVPDFASIIDNTQNQGIVDLAGGMRMQWFTYESNEDGNQTVTFPYAFDTDCVSVTTGPNMSTNFDLILTRTDFIINRDDSISGSRNVFIQAIGY